MNREWTTPCILVVIALLVVCCCCATAAAVVGGAGFFVYEGIQSPTPTPLPIIRLPEPPPTDTLETLKNTTVPVNDPLDLAMRLRGLSDIPATLPPPEKPYDIGDRLDFWVTNTDTNINTQIQASLQYRTDHAYFWVQDGISFNADDLKQLADTFENQIYPTNREFFGSEWTPGIDGEERLYILYAKGLGANIAGYFSTSDEMPAQIHPYSNQHEMFIFSADNVAFDEEFTYAVLAHEFQHMIHWYGDRNETSWLNEGFSELATLINNYNGGGHDFSYANQPDIQLNDWPTDHNQTLPHYGAAFLFTTYFLDRFGEKATQALVADPENGMDSVDNVLAQIGAVDPLTGQPIRADDFFQQWTLANYLHDPSVADGRYTYSNYEDAPQTDDTETTRNCPSPLSRRTVKQYGVDYIRITCSGDYTLHFEGSTQVGVLAQDAHSGRYAFWSNKGDESDMTLTRRFDFTAYNGPLTFSYWTWYDLEKDYDYLYLEASLDGKTWQILETPSCTTENVSGNSYGCGYNGMSGGQDAAVWINEKVDLSPLAGKTVWLRFEYVTDAAVNGEGLLLDDLSIPEAGYSEDFEAGEGGWEGAGFVRIQNVLPQTFRLALITFGTQTSVEFISLSADNVADIPLDIGSGVRSAVLVVSGTTRFTRQPATYQYQITR